jgi:hypothetical protein
MTNAMYRCSRILVLSLGLLTVGGLISTARAQVPGAGGFVSEQVKIINQRIAEKWKENKLTPSKQATDYEFLRRATLDIIGRIATPKEITKFFNDPPQTRRSQLVERLLNSDEYDRNWATIWTTWLLTRSGPREYHEQMHLWLEERFSRKDHAWDKTVLELLTATGKNSENGAVNFVLAHLGEPTPADKVGEEGQFNYVPITSRTARLFLGMQIQCVQCHDHPFNSILKQKHFWGVNAFFRQVERKGTPAMQRNMPAANLELVDNTSWNMNQEGKPAEIFYEKRNGLVLPAKPEYKLPHIPKDQVKKFAASEGTRRQQLADDIIKDEYLAVAFINRMWFHFFGHGMNSPGAFDDLNGDNQITHPELMKYLPQEFRAYGHNPRELIRWICNSEAYGLSSVANKTNEKADTEPFFSRMLLKSMSPEQLFESLMVATEAEAAETKAKKKELREQWMRKLIVNFGDDEGNEASFNGTVVQALILMNGKEINEAICQTKKGPIVDAVKKHGGKNHQATMEAIFLATLNRKPTSKENSEIMVKLRGLRVPDKDPLGPWEDLLWALINSNEFILNH